MEYQDIFSPMGFLSTCGEFGIAIELRPDCKALRYAFGDGYKWDEPIEADIFYPENQENEDGEFYPAFAIKTDDAEDGEEIYFLNEFTIVKYIHL